MENKTNCSVGKQYKTNEKVSGNKFWTGFLSFFNPVLWLKDIVSLFNLRKLTIYLLIAVAIFSFAYVRGLGEKPVNIKLGWGKEAYVRISDDEMLHIDKKGNVYVEDPKTGKILKQVKAKDIKGLKSRLAPIGLQLKPFILGGLGIGTEGNSGLEVGAGVSFLRIWKANLDAFLTNKGIYGGISYKLTDNSGFGAGIGKGWKKDEYRGIIYYKWEF